MVKLMLGLAVLALVPAAWGQFTFTTNGNNTISITGYNTAAGLNVIVPASTNGYPVVSLGYQAFANSNITNAIIPDSVTNIGGQAFSGCSWLTSATLGSGITTISNGTFGGCSALTSLTIPNSVTSIGLQAFSFSGLTNVIIPDGVTNISIYAFWSCSGLTSLTIGKGVTYLGQSMFCNCPNLTSVAIGNGVTTIENGAFYACPSLTNLTLGSSVTNLGSQAFDNCSSLARVAIPNSVTSIGYDAFASCTSLNSLSIPGNVTSVGDYAFNSCASLTNITFHGNAPALGGTNVFSGVAPGATVYYYSGTTGWGPTYGGLPTVMLFAPPQIGSASASLLAGNFGFTLTGASNQTVVVEASTNLMNWQPVWTNTLSGTSTNFTDPQWHSYPRRYYRAR